MSISCNRIDSSSFRFASKMPKINKNKNKTELNRNRVRIFRGIQNILQQDRNIHTVIENQNATNVNGTAAFTGHISNPNLNHLPNFTHRDTQSSLSDQLRSWALEFHLTRRAVSKLLKILISCGMRFLPKDSRTLLSTPKSINIENRAGGQYWHNGIKSGLCSIFFELNTNLAINMNFNVDGLPLFKSSPIEFWPILANIRGK